MSAEGTERPSNNQAPSPIIDLSKEIICYKSDDIYQTKTFCQPFSVPQHHTSACS